LAGYKEISMNRFINAQPLILAALVGCGELKPNDSVDTVDTGDTIEEEVFTTSSLSWQDPEHLPIVSNDISATDDRVLLATLHGVLELQGEEWVSLDNRELGAVQEIEAFAGSIVVSNRDGGWLMAPDSETFEPIVALDGYATFERGEAGVFASNSVLAYQILPEFIEIGDANGVVNASCSSQVNDRDLRIFSTDINDWVEVALPDDLVNIFEFAARGDSERWVFGWDSVWFTEDNGVSWDTPVYPEGFTFDDMRRDGERLVTMMDDGVGWSDDGGLSWERSGQARLAFMAHDLADGRIVYSDSYGATAPVLKELPLEPGAEPRLMPELPRQKLGPFAAKPNGEVVVVSDGGTYILDGVMQACRMCKHDILESIRDTAVDGASNPGLWIAGYVNPDVPTRIPFVDGDHYTGTPLEGWPKAAGGENFVATGLAAYSDGIAACTSKRTASAESSETAGSGVFWQNHADPVWRALGTDFPESSHDPLQQAGCSALFQSGDRLYAVADGLTVALDDTNAWAPVSGIGAINDIVATADGVWALVGDELAWSSDGWSFEEPDPRTAGTVSVDVLDGELVSVQTGLVLLGSPGERAAIEGLNSEALIDDVGVYNGHLLARTNDDTLVWAQ